MSAAKGEQPDPNRSRPTFAAVVGVTADLIRGDIFYWGSLMPGAVVASLTTVSIYVWFLDYYVSGLTAGAVKG